MASKSPKAKRSAASLRVLASQERERQLSRQFIALCIRVGIPKPEQEHRFALDLKPPRQWRFDFAWPKARVALESEGGAWSNGAHTRGGHFLSDMDKYNAAALHGWRVFRTVPGQLLDVGTLRLIASALGVTLMGISGR